MTPAAPVLKWAGGKRQLIPAIDRHFPARIRTYYEPFVGGGAVFFHLANAGRFERAVLSDVNPELVNVYRVIQSPIGCEQLIQALAMINPEPTLEQYHQIRDLLPESISTWLRAARTIYLNRRGFNGLYRVNRKGEFNNPYGGRNARPGWGRMPDPELIRACHRALAGVEIRVATWSVALLDPLPIAGDLVYFDPPYVPLSKTANFTAYTKGGFSDVDQVALAERFGVLARRGVHVVASNSDTPRVRELYAGHELHPVQARRRVGASRGSRASVGELIIVGRAS